MSFEVTGLMTVARILVLINMRKGLYQELLIESSLGILCKPWTMRESHLGVIDAMSMGTVWKTVQYPSREKTE
jgi:hypothetical protein